MFYPTLNETDNSISVEPLLPVDVMGSKQNRTWLAWGHDGNTPHMGARPAVASTPCSPPLQVPPFPLLELAALALTYMPIRT